MKRALLLSTLIFMGCSPSEPRYELYGDGHILLDKGTGCVWILKPGKGYDPLPVRGLQGCGPRHTAEDIPTKD